MAGWHRFPYPDQAYDYAGAALKKAWPRLHRGDRAAYPGSLAVQDAWRAYHRGDFEEARKLGIKAGAAGIDVANKAQIIYATYLETHSKKQLSLFEEAAARAEAHARQFPGDANAHYLQALALGRYSRGISVLTALAQGLGGRIRAALERAIELEPRHADAHIALGAYHAEVIDKVGAALGRLTYGVAKDKGVEHFETALKLNPDSAIARCEYADGLIMLYGKRMLDQARDLYAQAASSPVADAMERLDVEAAKAELAD